MGTERDAAATPGSERYVLATGAQGEGRLEMLEALYGPTTETLLTRLGIAPGQRVIDVGCGVGTVVAWQAARVAPGGTACGVDNSQAQLESGAARASRLGLSNAEFVLASAYDIPLPDGSFDFVGCRSLLSHLVDPEAAVREMARLVKPGGYLICEDIDMRTIHTEPPSAAYDRIVDLYYELARSTRCDYSVGARLTDLLIEAGFDEVDSERDQPAPRVGPEKRWWELTFIETAPAMMTAGVLTQAEFDRLCREIAPLGVDSTTAIFQPAHYQAWGRRSVTPS